LTKILVIEDTEDVLQQVITVLERDGFEVIGAPDGAAGLKVVYEAQPDLVVCDIMMPGMTGYDVLEALRSDVRWDSLPFIFLTARIGVNDIGRAMNMGADGYLTKPFTAKELVKTVRTRLARQQALRRVNDGRFGSLLDQTSQALSNARPISPPASPQGEPNEDFQLLAELEYGLQNRQLELHYQPQVSLTDGRIIGAEALLRWRHPQRGYVPPNSFISLAERSGLIHDLGDWVIKEVCRQVCVWRDLVLPTVPIAINLSTTELGQAGLSRSILNQLERSGLAPASLELEVTETSFMHNMESTHTNLTELRQAGVTVAIDDFGTGYSSLTYLRELPADKIKIDRVFITNLANDKNNQIITRSVIEMAHHLGLKVIAEGVEEASELAILQAHRCDEFQGYYFSRPVPAAELAAMFRDGKMLSSN
jgi:EAL domain-containing protein (putative c-di-GMP-specific phosphodiesterase class I)/CheY-like chemotaxis protein